MEKLIYKIDEKKLRIELKKLRSLNYNKFFWWRKYSPKIKPLPESAPFLDRIRNGDFELSHYYWQVQQAEYEINQLYSQISDPIQFAYEAKLVRARRGKLLEDLEKDENLRMENLKKGFLENLFITEENYESEIIEFGGNIEKFYLYCKSKYGERIFKLKTKKRGRPKKVKN